MTPREIRAKLREMIDPYKRTIDHLEVNESIGRLTTVEGKPVWQDNVELATIDFTVYPSEGCPIRAYEGNVLHVVHSGATLDEAFEQVQLRINQEIPKWWRDLEIDANFSQAIGREVRTLLPTSEYALNQFTDGSPEGIEFRKRKKIELTVGDVAKGVEHRPGRLIFDFEGALLEIYHWMFTNYTSDTKGIRTPRPYFEFVDGYQPWAVLTV